MHPILDYFIKANGLLLFFWLFYRLFLHKETFYTTNRWYLLGSIVVSLVAPFITFTKTVFIEAPKPTIVDWDQLATINTQNTIVKDNLFTLENFAIVTIALISTILVLKTLFQLVQTYRNIQKLPIDASLQVRRSNNDTIFSLYPYIVVPNHFEKIPNSDMILSHEQVHIQQKHSFDMIVMQLIRSVFWMNPLLRYLQKDIEVNLEYIVDEHLQTQFDSKTYQLSLLSFHTATPQPFVNSFNSQLKKRILQINSKKSNPMKKLKLLLATPALIAFFGLFQIETKAQITESLIVEQVTENSKIEEDSFNIMIHPSYDDAYYERIQKMLNEKYHLEVKFSNLKRNEKGDLVNFDITYKQNNKRQRKTFQSEEHKPINTLNLLIRKEKNQYIIEEISEKISNVLTKEIKNEDIVNRINKKNTNIDLSSKNNNDYEGRYSVVTIDQNGTNIQFPKNSKQLEDGTIVSEDGRILARIETNDNENKNKTFVVNGKKVSQEEASIYLKNNKNAKTTILNDVIVIESNEIKQVQSNKTLYILNGKEISETDFRTIQPDDIESVTVLKDKNAIEKYGAKGKDGVIEIQLKDKKS